MSLAANPHTMFHTFEHPLSVWAERADHVPVSQHAAVAALSKASHYSTGYRLCQFMLESDLRLHCSAPRGKLHSDVHVCRNTVTTLNRLHAVYAVIIGVHLK